MEFGFKQRAHCYTKCRFLRNVGWAYTTKYNNWKSPRTASAALIKDQ